MKHAILLSLIALALGVAVPAFAQQTAPDSTMPSAVDLKTPTSAAPASPVAATVTTTTTTPAPTGNTADTMTGMPDDPCPNLKGAEANAPDDLSKVQEDIDRFTLCVQRAQLLERLNESAQKSIQSTDATLGLSGAGSTGVLAPPAGGALPPLPANALAGADVSPAAAPAAATPAAPATPAAATTAPADAGSAWTIREIYGSTTEMQARLISPAGDEVKVKKGMKLSDGSVVTDITPSGVSIRGTSGIKSLEWVKS